MILFMHGLNSSNQTNKFSAIKREDKVCETVDYSIGYEKVSEFYDELIKLHQPDVLVGHSLGGYWALTKGAEYQLPVVLINPALFTEYQNYPSISDDVQVCPSVYAYLEMGDEVLPIERIKKYLENDASLLIREDGHHRVQYLENVNEIVERYYAYELIC